MKFKIKQIIPVPENISTILPAMGNDGTDWWEDTAQEGWPVLLALVEDAHGNCTVCPYSFDWIGNGKLDRKIQFRPAIHCKKCSQKMWIVPHKEDFEQPKYECACGVTYDAENGWSCD